MLAFVTWLSDPPVFLYTQIRNSEAWNTCLQPFTHAQLAINSHLFNALTYSPIFTTVVHSTVAIPCL